MPLTKIRVTTDFKTAYAECQAFLKELTEDLEEKTKKKLSYAFTAGPKMYFTGPTYSKEDTIYFEIYEKKKFWPDKKIVLMKSDLDFSPYEGMIYIHILAPGVKSFFEENIHHITSQLRRIFSFVRFRYILQ